MYHEKHREEGRFTTEGTVGTEGGREDSGFEVRAFRLEIEEADGRRLREIHIGGNGLRVGR